MDDFDSELDLADLVGLIDEKPSNENSHEALNGNCTKSLETNEISSLQAVDLFNSPTCEPEKVLAEKSLVHADDSSSDEEEGKVFLNEFGKQVRKNLKTRVNYDQVKDKETFTWTSSKKGSSEAKLSTDDNYFGVRIMNPLVSFSTLKERMQGRKFIKMSFMTNFIKKGDIEGDWVTIGVVVRKLPPKTSKKGTLFSIWKLTDLQDPEKIVSLFLFGHVHKEHWKTSLGSVVGLLNLSIMPNDNHSDEISLNLDHPGKLMLIGTSKDFGHCKSKRKDGERCSNIVNLSQCEYCVYHLKSQYQKFSKRSEIQSSFSGPKGVLKHSILKGQNYFYGGQSFVPLGKPAKKANSAASKDQLTLSNLTLKRKASEVFAEEKDKGVKKVAEMYGEELSKIAGKNSEFINNQLIIPSAGSKHFLHMMKSKIAQKDEVKSFISPKEMLKQHELILKSKLPQRKTDDQILKMLVPQLAKGLSPGQDVCLGFSSKSLKHSGDSGDLVKLQAIRKIKEKGPIAKRDPNSVKHRPEQKKIIEALKQSVESDSESANSVQESSNLLKNQLRCIDLNSEKIQHILKKRSSHDYEIEMTEMEREAAYFAKLEKREQMEEKMSSTKEIVCDVVSCKKCQYTAHSASKRCIQESHPLKTHKAVKRFYECKDCKNRVTCFTRFPRSSCRCGGSKYVRTGMARISSAPLLASEVLNITNHDPVFLNS